MHQFFFLIFELNGWILKDFLVLMVKIETIDISGINIDIGWLMVVQEAIHTHLLERVLVIRWRLNGMDHTIDTQVITFIHSIELLVPHFVIVPSFSNF